MKTVFIRIGEAFLKAFLALASLMPLKVHYFNSRWLAVLLRKVIRYRVKLVRKNLSCAFPMMTEEDREKLLKKFYRHLADIMVEAIWFGGCKGGNRLRKSHIVELGDLSQLRNMYQEKGSVVVMYTHCGNWELLGGVPKHYNYSADEFPVAERDFCVVYRKIHDSIWDDVMKINRYAPVADKNGYEGYLESRSLVRYVLMHRNDRKMFNINTDQRPYFEAPDYIRVDFMNRRCNTMSGAAALAHKLAMPVFFQHMRRKAGYGYTIDYELICEDASTMTAEQIMKKYYLLLEADIRKQPENYIWTHNRWS